MFNENQVQPTPGSNNLFTIPKDTQELSFTFEGNGRDYLPIWVANFFLCLITLGLFTPWAKVRARRYFYSRTMLAEHSFTYRGDPWRILTGRVILAVMGLFLLTNSILNFVSINSFLVVLLIAGLLVPFVIWKSALFNFSNTSYRSILLSLDLSLKEVYVWAFKTFFLSIVTIGIGATTLSYQYRAFFLSHLRFGQTPFHHRISTSDVFKKLFPFALLLCVILVGAGMILRRLGPEFFIVQRLLSWFGFIVYLGVSDSISTTYICDNLQLGEIQFRSRIDKWELARLYAKAGALTFISLGFAWPWVRIEILRYKLERIKLYAPLGVMDSFTQAESKYDRSIGGFATELFEFDFGI